MNLTDIIKNVNSFIGDSSLDRVSSDERYQSITEATAWLLEELGNEHMTDRIEVEYLPTVTWYKMDNLTPYLLTAGQLRFKEEAPDRIDFTRVEPRDLASQHLNKYSYAIERYNSDSYMGIIIPDTSEHTYKELVPMNISDGLTYTGTNAVNITPEKNDILFDMDTDGVTSTGITTTTESVDISSFENNGVLIFEIEIPDITDVTSVTLKFGADLLTDYYYSIVSQDVNGNSLVEGVNTIKISMSDLTLVGTPSFESITEWSILVNHETTKPAVEGFKFSDLRITTPIYLTFKYIFYRVGKNTGGDDIIEFSSDTDVPFFIERYPQYRFAVAHKAASSLFRAMQSYDSASTEDSLAEKSLKRFRKNFSAERDMSHQAFKVAGVNFRRRTIRRR